MYIGNYTEEILDCVYYYWSLYWYVGLHAWEVELLCVQYIHRGLMCLVLSLIPGHPYMELQIRFLLLQYLIIWIVYLIGNRPEDQQVLEPIYIQGTEYASGTVTVCN